MKNKKMLAAIIGIMMTILSFASAFADMRTPYVAGFIEGFIYEHAVDGVTIEEYDGTRHTIEFTPYPQLVIDDKEALASDFRPGMEIYAEIQGNRISYMESYSVERTAYIKEGSKLIVGTVKNIDRNQLTVEILTGEEKTYVTYPATIVNKDGLKARIEDLYAGDKVKMYFDEYNSNMISRMEVEGNETTKIKGIYKAKIDVLDPYQNSLRVNSVKLLKNGEWVDDEYSKEVTLSPEIKTYASGYPVSNEKLKYYKGNYVYLAIKDFYGDEQVEQMVLKNNYELSMSEKIESINWFTDSMELSNKKNLLFNDGTIVVKGDRMVDKYAIDAEDDAFIVGDGRGSNLSADLVSIYNENINNSNAGNYQLYVTRLDQLDKYKLTTEKFYILDTHEWESFRFDKEFYYDDDTSIYDMENKKFLTREQFYSGNYSVDEDSDYVEDRNLKDWYAYIYTNGDRIVAAAIKQDLDSLNNLRTTVGNIASISDDDRVGNMVVMKDTRDWSKRKEEWMPKTKDTNLILEKALVIKGDKIVTPKDLKVGDKLYVVRDSSRGKIIIVK